MSGFQDPFADDNVDDTLEEFKKSDNYVHIRIQPRNGRKNWTIVENLPRDIDLKKVVSICKKSLACNGSVQKADKTKSSKKGDGRGDGNGCEEEQGIIIFQGDHRNAIKQFLLSNQIIDESKIQVHGF